MKTSQSIKEISAALVKAQSEMGNASKDSSNPFFKSKYADLNSIREAILPALHKHGISVLQNPQGDLLETVLLHTSGEFISSEIKIVSKTENNPQDYGSAISYARRYALQSMLCIGAEDDDGNSATAKKQSQAKENVHYYPPSDDSDFEVDYSEPSYQSENTAPTPKQLNLLRNNKIDIPPNLTREQATKLVGQLFNSRNRK